MRLPKGWKTCRLGDVVDPRRPISYGVVQTGENIPDGVPCVRVVDLTEGSFDIKGMIRTSPAVSASYGRTVLEKDDIMVALRGEIGRAALVPGHLAGANLTRGIALLSRNPTTICCGYLLQALNSPKTKLALRHGVNGTGLMEIPIGNLREVVVDVPPLPEQRKIADILGTWDEALEKLDAVIAAKARRKLALMQQLLTGKRRLPGSRAPVEFIRASEIFTNRTERNSRGAPILSVTQDQGVVVRTTLDRRISHDIETNDTYKVVYPGDYIISLRSFQGGLEYSEMLGAVSPAYHVIRPITEIDREFYRHYFKSADFVSRLSVAVIGIRDGKQISFTDFGFIKLPNLHIDDQNRIGQMLSAADAELRLLRDQRAAVDQQKRGLMQQLLTGRIRTAP